MKALLITILMTSCASCAPEEPFTPGIPPSLTKGPDAGPDAGVQDADAGCPDAGEPDAE